MRAIRAPPDSRWTDSERDGVRVLFRPALGPAASGLDFFFLVVVFGIVGINMLLLAFGDALGFTSTGNPIVAWFVMALFGLVGLLVLYRAAHKAWGTEEFALGDEEIVYRKTLFGHTKTQTIAIDTVEDVGISWRTRTSSQNGSNQKITYFYFVIDTGFKEHCFGKEMSKPEKLWAASAIRDHVAAHKQPPPQKPQI